MKRALHLRRNIAILAHVDAGKTTLTERMLFAAGRIHRMGETHDGASAMDHRAVERRHGVTVSAAATVFDWDAHRIALIDTPGHVDFTLEVERALTAVDGVVTLFSAVGGVEPQTETVWAQTARAGLPRIGFVNKMDAAGADFAGVLGEIERRLGGAPAAIQWPALEDGALVGALDLVEERLLSWPATRSDPSDLSPRVEAIPGAWRETVAERRAALVATVAEALADAEPETADAYLSGARFDASTLRRMLRRATLERRICPVLLGAAYRGVGVAPLLDAVCAFGPSPLDRGAIEGVDPETGAAVRRQPDPDAPLAALATKVAVTRFGPLATVRVFSGRLAPGARVRVLGDGQAARIGRVLEPHAGETREIDGAGPGEIVAVSGLDGVGAGDALVAPTAPIALPGLRTPEPVMEAAVEAISAADQAKLGPALAALVREDPSLRLSVDPETGAPLLAGMGELHLQIALETLADERGVAARIGPPRVSYREAPTRTAEAVHTLRKQSGGPGQFARVALRLDPSETEGLRFEDAAAGGVIPAEFKPAIVAALEAALSEGVFGYPIAGVHVVLTDGAHHAQDSSSLAFATATREAFRAAYAEAAPALLEPLARIEALVPETDAGGVIADLQARRGAVSAVSPWGEGLDARTRIVGEAPLANLWGYVGALRSLTSGRGTAQIAYARHAPAPASMVAALGAEDGADPRR
ncbi:MAG: translation factor GTPase family protein [Pseudomonadota bacterium]